MKMSDLRPLIIVLCLIALLIAGGFQSSSVLANPGPFQTGDVFASVSDGLVQHYNAAGSLLETFNTGQGQNAKGLSPFLGAKASSDSANTTGCAFDSVGNLYVTTFADGAVVRFAGPGDPHTNLNGFGSGYSGHPESIVFDSTGNAYVGSVDGDNKIRKFDGAGNPLAQYAVAIENRGSDWIDLAADQKTMFYTSEGRKIKRYDVSSGAQLADFATLPGSSTAYALRLLPPGDGSGGLLVADMVNVKRLDGSGNVVQTYNAPNENSWFALNLDPDGKSFWSGNTTSGKFFKFDISTGNILLAVDTQRGTNKLFGLCVYKEITSATDDKDGDGLPDSWEKNGIPGANLPAMGADPYIKDVFVQVDWMQDATHNLKPDDAAIQKIVDAFANSGVDSGKGIHLHVDVGPDSTDRYNKLPGNKWGNLGKGHSIPYQDVLGQGSSLDQAVTALLRDGRPRQSDLVFHYAFFVHQFVDSKGKPVCNSGISPLPQVFLVSLGCTGGKGSTNEQAGTFMHELGHNLGLCHGGPANLAIPQKQCDVNYKPNYLSVMNYSFQTGGLIINGKDGNFDYSRFKLPDLKETAPINETALSEPNGLNGGSQAANYGTKHRIGSIGSYRLCIPSLSDYIKFRIYTTVDKKANGPIDWNCNVLIENSVQVDANGDGSKSTLISYSDWDNLNYKWGNIGLGSPPPITITPSDVAAAPIELTPADDAMIQRINEPRGQSSASVTPNTVPPKGVVAYTITMFNTDASDLNGIAIVATLPAGFSYQVGSTSGATTADPSINGQNLTWGAPFNLPASGGKLTLAFRATASSSSGTYFINISGSSSTGVVLPTGDTAPVSVTAPVTPTPAATAGIIVTDVSSGTPSVGLGFTTDLMVLANTNGPPGLVGIEIYLGYNATNVVPVDADLSTPSIQPAELLSNFFGSMPIQAANEVLAAPACPSNASNCVHLSLVGTPVQIQQTALVARFHWQGLMGGSAGFNILNPVTGTCPGAQCPNAPRTAMSNADGYLIPITAITVRPVAILNATDISGSVIRQGIPPSVPNTGTLSCTRVEAISGGLTVATTFTDVNGNFGTATGNPLFAPVPGNHIIRASYPGYLNAEKGVVATGAPMPLGTTKLYGGDVNGDNTVNILDIVKIIANLGRNVAPPRSWAGKCTPWTPLWSSDDALDINDDGIIDISDLSIAAGNFSRNGPTPWGP